MSVKLFMIHQFYFTIDLYRFIIPSRNIDVIIPAAGNIGERLKITKHFITVFRFLPVDLALEI
jgi:hypothetical protein